jgi:hypothetical protein
MKTLMVCLAAGAVAALGFSQTKWESWKESTQWNTFALRESGLGRTVSRAMTNDADRAWHHGLAVTKPSKASNPVSRWIDQGVSSTGFQGRLEYRPPSKFPIRPSEVREVLAKTEKDLSTAFRLDPGNYEAYDAYLMFLTTQIRETEFGALDGQKPGDDGSNDNGAEKPDSNSDDEDDVAAVQRFRKWEEEEQRRRNLRAVAITDYAISRFSSKDKDPERYLGLAMTYYNRFTLGTPDVPSRKNSFIARRLFETQALQTAEKMRECLQSAQSYQQKMMASGIWQNRSAERLNDYQQVEQMVRTYIDALYRNMISNRGLDFQNPAPRNLVVKPLKNGVAG